MTEAVVIGIFGILLQAGLAGWLLRTIMKPVDALRLMLMDMRVTIVRAVLSSSTSSSEKEGSG